MGNKTISAKTVNVSLLVTMLSAIKGVIQVLLVKYYS